MTPTPTAAARVSGTIKLAEAVDHLNQISEYAGMMILGPALYAGEIMRRADAVLDILESLQPDPEPVPVAWQWRYRADTTNGDWSDWFDGKTPVLASFYEAEERPLYVTPSSAGTVSVEAAARVLLEGFERAQIDSSIIKLFQNGQHVTALRALTGEGGR